MGDLIHTESHKWTDFYTISSTFLSGALVSFIFYYLVVHIPERNKRNIIKFNFLGTYRDLKEDIALYIIWASREGGRNDIDADTDTVEKMMTVQGFRALFEGGKEANEGWYAFANGISKSETHYRDIIFNLHILRNQVDYILHNYPINDNRIFDFFKRLEITILRLEHSGMGYDEEKILSRFLWSIFSGFNHVDGFIGYDIVEKMIEDL